jgi:PAS domain S-box-containing protein
MGTARNDTEIDWASAASVLAEGSAFPVALLSRDHRFVGTNGEFERLLGWTAEELDDRCWLSVLTPSPRVEASHRLLVAAGNGDVRAFHLDVVQKRGEGLTLSMQAQAFGRAGTASGLALFVRSASPIRSSGLPLKRYLVETASGRWRVIGGDHGGGLSSLTCYQALYRRETPCDICPLRPDPQHPRAVIRPAAVGLELVDAAPVGPEIAEVSVVAVRDSVMTSIYNARLHTMAERARLSEREIAVLEQIVLGHSQDDIATTLGIRARTVKFHQYNAFEKLGVDSPFDLLRRLL